MKDIMFTVSSVRFITDMVFRLELSAETDLPTCCAGQFLHLEIPNQPTMLRRPFCLYCFSKRSVTLLIATVGKGTAMLARLQKGDRLRGILPLGNGFPRMSSGKKIALLGGGVGCAPLLAAVSCNPDCEVRAYLGFGSDNPLRADLETDFSSECRTTVSTEDGSYGFKGYVTEAFLSDCRAGYRPDVIFACGADAMIKAVAKLARDNGIDGYASGEARMGCGVGACLVCTCPVKDEGGTVHNKRMCADGPVFRLEDLVL